MGWRARDGSIHALTYKQFEAWQEWFDVEYNIPGRTDYYIMQLTGVVIDMFSKQRTDLETIILKFVKKVVEAKTDEDKVADSKAFWSAVTGHAIPDTDRNGSTE